MKPLVVSSRAVNVKVQKSRLVIDDYLNRTHQEYPPHELPFDFLVFANATGNLTLSAVKFLVRHEIPVQFLDWDGSSMGSLLPPRPIGGELQIAQLKAYLDPEIRHFVASKFLEEKFAKTVQLLVHLKKYYPQIDLRAVTTEAARSAPTRGPDLRRTLMVKEGQVANAYFHEIAKVIRTLAPEFGFRTRGQSSSSNNNGASDPFNVALNVAYGILESRVRMAVNQAGLLEGVGFLHEAQQGALPLVYDVMEPFRWLADISMIRLLERGELTRSSFLVTDRFRGRMDSRGVRLVAEELGKHLGRTTIVTTERRKYETVLLGNLRKLARFLGGTSGTLDFSATFELESSFATVTQRRVLAEMTVEGRKRLNIPKTTLWCRQRQLRAGKVIKHYRSRAAAAAPK